MSLEATLIPIALVVINVIDREYYNSWIKNKRIKIDTCYAGLNEFIIDLNQSRYHYDINQDTVRICGKNNEENYYFSNIDGKWVLSFSEYDSMENIMAFLDYLSDVSGGKIPNGYVDQLKRKHKKTVVLNNYNGIPKLKDKVNVYPTIYSDEKLLAEVLISMGISFTNKNEEFHFILDGIKCSFIKNKNNNYILRTVGNISDEDLFRTIQELDIVYLKNVQKKSYDSVISKLSNYNFSIESEIVTEDDTIVLTINVD